LDKIEQVEPRVTQRLGLESIWFLSGGGNMKIHPHWSAIAWLWLLALFAAGDARAQADYPNKPVRIVVDSAPGSANDVTLRILAERLSRIWGQQVLPLNHPGAGGSISTRVAATAPADGYTLYMPATSAFLALPGGPGVAPNLPIELPRDFVSIGFVLHQPIFIGVAPALGITTVPQLIALAKQKPNEISYAATGRGRLTHLTMELLQSRAGIKLQLVPYAGGPSQAMNDLISGRVGLVLDAYAGLAGALQGGLIKGLAVSSAERLPGFADLPTVAETLPGFLVGAWNVVVAPNGTPEPIVRKVAADLRTALEDPEIVGKFAAFGAYVRYMPPAEVTAFTQSEQKIWRPIMEQVAREAQ
jgi:tripartite-type tricarboxylate transporter receptor subunit TctC